MVNAIVTFVLNSLRILKFRHLGTHIKYSVIKFLFSKLYQLVSHIGQVLSTNSFDKRTLKWCKKVASLSANQS